MGVEILDIEHTRVKFKINIIIKIKISEQRAEVLLLQEHEEH